MSSKKVDWGPVQVGLKTEDEALLSSGVRYRCACGAESDWQRDARLPPLWSVAFVMVAATATAVAQTRPRFVCPGCVVLPSWRQQAPSGEATAPVESEESKLEQLRREASTARRKKRKR